MDLNNIEKPDFKLYGNYRGIVEDNDDPLDAGRLKIRIFGVYDSPNISIEELPWAEPALGLNWSGGYNTLNKDWIGGKPLKNKGFNYDPGSKSKVSGTQVNANGFSTPANEVFSEEKVDPYHNACGTGGNFVVPKRGNWLFVFFDGGNPMKPIYFAMAPVARDWKTQGEVRDADIQQKIAQIEDFKKTFKLADIKNIKKPSTDTDENWADSALVDPKVSSPHMTIGGILSENANRDIYSVVSPNGTTIVMDNRESVERLYVIHKNTIDHVDENGNKKLYIGKSHNRGGAFNTVPDSNIPSDYEVGVEGNHELHIVGRYKVYALGDISLKTQSSLQIESSGHVGIAVSTGDVDLVIKEGNLNADVKGSLNANVLLSANIKVNGGCNLKVKQNVTADVGGEFNLTSVKAINIKTLSDFNLSVGGNINIASANLNITSTNIKTTGEFGINGSLKVSNTINTQTDLVVGTVAYVGAGIDCGGFLRNKGIADIGPVIAHNLTVVGGTGTGTGRRPTPPPVPDIPDPTPKPAIKIPTIDEKANLIIKTVRSAVPEDLWDLQQKLSNT